MSSQDASGRSLPILQQQPKHNDRVCGMMLVPERAAAKLEHAGKTYYLCSNGCTGRFSREPEKFLAAPGAAGMGRSSALLGNSAMEHGGATASLAAADEKKIRYTCPMHPEINRFGPGSCPICGMALESMDVFAEMEADPDDDSMCMRLWVSV